jgi:hypothetical protein
MSFEDPNFELLGKIHDTIADAKLYANQIEKLINDHPAEEYSIPTENLMRMRAQLSLVATLATCLFEENQHIKDQIADLMRKHAIIKKD